MTQLMQEVEKRNMKKKFARFYIGDTIRVKTKIIEGNKERMQAYQGLCIAKKGSGLSATFTVYRVAFGYANEKVFPVHSPNVIEVEVLKRGNVRRSKLNFIRGKVGKAAKVRSRFGLDEATEETLVAEDQVVKGAAPAAEEASSDPTPELPEPPPEYKEEPKSDEEK